MGETVRDIIAKVEELKPSRVVVDSLSELRLLAQTPVRYLRQILALKHFFAAMRCTVLMLDDKSASGSDLQLQSIAHGVVMLEQTLSGFGAQRRRLHVVKMRGVRFRGGYHDFEIERGGLCVYAGGEPVRMTGIVSDATACGGGCPSLPNQRRCAHAAIFSEPAT